nr:helix-hairpin-helix domain-containing protein [Aurantibacter crassamenti]
MLQLGYFLWMRFSSDNVVKALHIDPLMQAQIDSLKKNAVQQDSIKIFPFNPNFITDYKGYTLGMSIEEIDRLHNFRKTNSYVNSKEEFQQVTKISDSLLQTIAPYFKFPEWTQNKKQNSKNYNKSSLKKEVVKVSVTKKHVKLTDLNTATAEDLKLINGIGEKLSARIVKFRDRLGGFVVKEQLSHVYGLESEVVENVFKQFEIKSIPTINKININEASVDDLTQLVYFNYDMARKIINYRDTSGGIVAFNELATIEGFPSEKLVIIQLYLSLN